MMKTLITSILSMEMTLVHHMKLGISNHFGVPTFVMNYPAAIKAFYMKPVPGNPERVLCADLLAPEGLWRNYRWIYA